MSKSLTLHSTEKQRAWLLPPDTKGRMGPGLYLVATPIGNLGDITLRALDVLSACDAVACEDTRVTARLFSHFGFKKPLWPYHDHNAAAQRPKILQAIRDGQMIALVSDAGTPLISDPGYKLVEACLEAGVMVTSLPGANAPLTALQLSGLPSDAFCFVGFLPPKQEACRALLRSWADAPGTLLAYETASRLLKTLKILAAEWPERRVCVARELTKLYEEMRRGLPQELVDYYDTHGLPKGEIVLAIAPPAPAEAANDQDIKKLLLAALKTQSVKEASAAIARQTGKRRSAVYALALTLSGKTKP